MNDNAITAFFTGTKAKAAPAEVVNKALEGFDSAVQKLKDAQVELAAHRQETEDKITKLKAEVADTEQHQSRLSRVVDRFTEMLS